MNRTGRARARADFDDETGGGGWLRGTTTFLVMIPFLQ